MASNASPDGGMFRALKNRNYRLYFMGQGISLIGTWMQQVALSWLTYKLTHSAMLLGLVAFAGQIPALVFTPFAGALADRTNRHRLLIISQSLAMLQALLLAWLTLIHKIDVTGIVSLGAFLGMISALMIPVQQAFLLEMIDDKKDLSNAIALNSSLMNGARLIGPALAGALVAWLGEGICFLLNGLSYIAVIVGLLMMQVKIRQQAAHQAPLLSHMKEGMRYAFGFGPIRSSILFMAAVSLFGMSYAVLMPVFARDILHGNAQTMGLLMGASGVGALVGALLLARRSHVIGLGRWITTASIFFSVGLMMFAFSRSLIVSMLILAFVGVGMMIQMGATNIVLQTMVDEDKRGRVMSLYTMAFMGMMPFGSLLAGWLGDVIGVPHTILLSGILCLISSLWLISRMPRLREEARPVYLAKGLIQDIPAPIPGG